MFAKYPHIGDKLNGFKSYRLRPKCAYNLYNDDYSTEKIFEILDTIETTDYIMLVFGEIDCRMHLAKYKDIDLCINKYWELIDAIKETHNNIILFGTHLARDNSTTKGCGTYQDRKNATIEFNSKLEQQCFDTNTLFINIFDNIKDENGDAMDEYFADYTERDIHLNSKVLPFVFDKLKKIGVLNDKN
ncbi:MAG: hypothetical protein KJ556_21930 [Gammaproteobacteria bacterium]|nr:hypothetical protein [Gammaproteobacteria bacterium]